MKMNDAKRTIFMAHLRSWKDGRTFRTRRGGETAQPVADYPKNIKRNIGVPLCLVKSLRFVESQGSAYFA
jgi:hypothetical protein